MSADRSAQIERYNILVQQYHDLDEQIDTLIEHHHGHSDNMDDAARSHYRDLARQRDEVYNEMRALEQMLLGVDDE